MVTWRCPNPFFVNRCAFHESWNFPAGVSFALKQNMYWGGSCAFLPDISGLGGGGGAHLLNFFIQGKKKNKCKQVSGMVRVVQKK